MKKEQEAKKAKAKNNKDSFFTEGFVKEVLIQTDSSRDRNISSVRIDPDSPFKVKIGDNDKILFVSPKNETAILHELKDQIPYSLRIDASCILMLKQYRTKVRFELDSKCKNIQKITAI